MSEIIIVILIVATVVVLIASVVVASQYRSKVEILKKENLRYIGTILDSSDALYRKGFGSVIAGLDKMRVAYLKNGGEEKMTKKMIRYHIFLVIKNQIASLSDLFAEFDINQQNQPEISKEMRELVSTALELPDTEKKVLSLFENEFEEINKDSNPACINEFKKKLKMTCFQGTDLWAKFYTRVTDLQPVS